MNIDHCEKEKWEFTWEVENTEWPTKQLNVRSTEPLPHYNWFTQAPVSPDEEAHCSASPAIPGTRSGSHFVGREAIRRHLARWDFAVQPHISSPTHRRSGIHEVPYVCRLPPQEALISKQVGKGICVLSLFSFCLIPLSLVVYVCVLYGENRSFDGDLAVGLGPVA